VTVENFKPSEAFLADKPLAQEERALAAGVFKLKLSGEVGSDKAISFERVRTALLLNDFNHLHVDITTNGGNSDEAFKIYEILRSLPNPVSTRARGKCFSAGVLIFAAGAFRAADADTEFLIHPASFDRDALPESVTAAILRKKVDLLASCDLRYAELLAGRTGTPREWFQTEMETEIALSASDAIFSGLVHQFDGLTMPVNPAWPAYARSMLANQRNIFLSDYYLTANYFAACQCAASLYVWSAG
jgi:ATP-dependent protease ClpP protease subunit